MLLCFKVRWAFLEVKKILKNHRNGLAHCLQKIHTRTAILLNTIKSNMLNVSQGSWARLTGLLCFDYFHKELGIRGI